MSLPRVEGVSVTNMLFGRKMLISWRLLDDVDGYKIYRSASTLGDFAKIVEVPQGVSQYVDTVPITWNVVWYYKVIAFKGEETSDLNDAYVVSDFTFKAFHEETFPLILVKSDFVFGEVPTKQVEGNELYLLTKYSFYENTVRVFVNGLRETRFQIVSNNKIKMLRPLSDTDEVIVDYIKVT